MVHTPKKSISMPHRSISLSSSPSHKTVTRKIMWSAPPLKQWSPCIPVIQLTPMNPASMCLPIRGSTTDFGTLGKAVVGAEQKQRNRKVSRATDEEKRLSGVDVLRALERATAQKIKKKKKERQGSALLSIKGNGQGRRDSKEDVKPLSIKEDWGVRLDELETRIQQILDTSSA